MQAVQRKVRLKVWLEDGASRRSAYFVCAACFAELPLSAVGRPAFVLGMHQELTHYERAGGKCQLCEESYATVVPKTECTRRGPSPWDNP